LRQPAIKSTGFSLSLFAGLCDTQKARKGQRPGRDSTQPASVNRTTHADGNTRFALALSRGLFLLITAT
jgi:hypothetical protein